MQYIAASLGVQCNYCHVQGQNDSDDKETKKIAREMMKMVDKLNATFFDGKPRVSCASCHNGRAKPVRTPPLAIDMTPEQAAAAAAGRGRGGRGGPGGPGRRWCWCAGAPAVRRRDRAVRDAASPSLRRRPCRPSRSIDIIAKYVQALGGQQAVQNAKTRVMTGTVTTRDLVTSNVTVQEKSTGEYRIDIATQPIPTTRATNGTSAWAIGGGGRGGGGGGGGAAPERARPGRLPDAAGTAPRRLRAAAQPEGRATRLFWSTRPTTRLTASRSSSSPAPPYPNVTEQLSFDRESGLLLRRVITTGSGGVGFSIMNLPEQIDYSDYRDVGGLKVAHTVRHATWNQVTTEKFTDVKINAPVADDVFAKPAPKQSRGRAAKSDSRR